MKVPRFRVRTLLIVVAVLALPLAWIAVRAARAHRMATAMSVMNVQQQVTSATWLDIQRDLQRQNYRATSSGGSTGASAGPDLGTWLTELEVWAGSGQDRRAVVRLKVEGGWDANGIQPIVITDLRAAQNSGAIERLKKAYDKERWRYRIVPAPR